MPGALAIMIPLGISFFAPGWRKILGHGKKHVAKSIKFSLFFNLWDCKREFLTVS
jgi:hypothetical protein